MPINTDIIYRPFLTFFRKKRMRMFFQEFQVTSETRILDVGGEPFNWKLVANEIDDLPKLFILNLYRLDFLVNNWIIADGRFLPFKDNAFDIVYCNSVIEHLHSLDNQKLFADEIKRVGEKYYIQTPNQRFFYEPHYLTPFVHWLPVNIRQKVIRNFSIWGLLTRPTHEVCKERIKEIRLLDEEEFNLLFPDARIWYEYFITLKKSLIAVKNDGK